MMPGPCDLEQVPSPVKWDSNAVSPSCPHSPSKHTPWEWLVILLCQPMLQARVPGWRGGCACRHFRPHHMLSSQSGDGDMADKTRHILPGRVTHRRPHLTHLPPLRRENVEGVPSLLPSRAPLPPLKQGAKASLGADTALLPSQRPLVARSL